MNILKCLLMPVVLVVAQVAAHAQVDVWESKPIHFVVPFPSAGPVDALARSVAQSITVRSGRTVIVENRPGAFGTIGSSLVAKAVPDGTNVLVMLTGGHSLTPAVMNVRYDPMKDLPPLAGAGYSDLLLVTGPRGKGKTLKDVIQEAKGASNGIAIGSVGTGSTNQLAAELFRKSADITAMHVPYNGTAPLMMAVMSGEVNLAVVSMSGVLANIQSGNVVPLAVASRERSPLLSSVPTMAEAGLPGVVVENRYGFFVPAGIPPEILQRLRALIYQSLAQPDVDRQLRLAGILAKPTNDVQLTKVIEEERDLLVPLAKSLGIRLD